MKTTRRRFLQTIGAGVTGAGFAGQTLAAVPGPVPIQFWDMKWGPPDIYANAARNMVNRYNAMNMDVNIGYQAIEWSSWPEIFFLAAESGQAPDISTGGAYQSMQLYEKGEILDIDDVIADLKQSFQGPYGGIALRDRYSRCLLSKRLVCEGRRGGADYLGRVARRSKSTYVGWSIRIRSRRRWSRRHAGAVHAHD
jgi:hypothetical protein